MLKPEEMLKLRIIFPKKYKRRVIEVLYSLGVIHLKDFSEEEYEKEIKGVKLGDPLEESPIIAENLLSLKTILLSLLDLGIIEKGLIEDLRVGKIKSKKFKIREIVEFVSEWKEFFEEKNKEIQKIDEKIQNLKEILSIMEVLKKLGIDPKLLDTEESKYCWIIGQCKPGSLSKIEDNLKKEKLLGKDAILSAFKDDNLCYAAIFFKKEIAEKIKQCLTSDFTEIDISKIRQFLKSEKSVDDIITEIKDYIYELKEKKEEIITEIREKFVLDSKKMLKMYAYLSELLEKSESPLKFIEGERFTVIDGWVPKSKREEVERKVKEITEGKAFIRFEKVDIRKEEAPVKLKNPGIVRNFQDLLEMYSLPKYWELDPTLFVFITFPIFFGFILGDLGYGLVSLIAFLILRKAMPKLKSFIDILILSSISTMFFGLIFGEFFGSSSIFGVIKLHPIIERMRDTGKLMKIAVLMGLIHINIGFISGFINEYRREGLKKAILCKASWMITEAGLILLYFHVKDLGYALTVLGVVMLAIGEKINGLVELPTLISHTLSYLRLMAVGLASVCLASVINNFASAFISKGGIFIVFAIGLLIMGHVVNLLLGLMEAFIHSLRLNYVEFFTKFYHGGGKPYVPFGSKKAEVI